MTHQLIDTTDYLSKIKARPKRKNIHSAEHDLADQMVAYFKEPKQYGRYLGVVMRLGISRASQIFGEVKDAKNADNPAALFFSKTKAKTPKK